MANLNSGNLGNQIGLHAHGHLTAIDPCLQLLSVMLNTKSVSLSHKTPKSQRSFNFDTGLNKTCGVHMLTLKLLYYEYSGANCHLTAAAVYKSYQ